MGGIRSTQMKLMPTWWGHANSIIMGRDLVSLGWQCSPRHHCAHQENEEIETFKISKIKTVRGGGGKTWSFVYWGEWSAQCDGHAGDSAARLHLPLPVQHACIHTKCCALKRDFFFLFSFKWKCLQLNSWIGDTKYERWILPLSCHVKLSIIVVFINF